MNKELSCGPAIQQFRRYTGRSAKKLGALLGRSQTQQSRLETGKSDQVLEMVLTTVELLGNPRLEVLYNATTDDPTKLWGPFVALPYELGVAVPKLAHEVAKFNSPAALDRYFQPGRCPDRCKIAFTFLEIMGNYELKLTDYQAAGWEEYTEFANNGEIVKNKTQVNPLPSLLTLGEAFAEVRNLRHLSTRKLGELMGGNHSFVTQFELGQTKISANNLVEGCRVVNLSVNDLLAIAYPDLTKKHPLFLPYADYSNPEVVGLVAEANRVFRELSLTHRAALMLDFNDWLRLETAQIHAIETDGFGHQNRQVIPTPEAFNLLGAWTLVSR